MGKLLYFASSSSDSLVVDSDRFICSVQQSATATNLLFKPATQDAGDTDVVDLDFTSGDHDVVMEVLVEAINFSKESLIVVFDAVSGDKIHPSVNVSGCSITQDS